MRCGIFSEAEHGKETFQSLNILQKKINYFFMILIYELETEFYWYYWMQKISKINYIFFFHFIEKIKKIIILGSNVIHIN